MPFQPAKLNYPKATKPALDPEAVALTKAALDAQFKAWEALSNLEILTGLTLTDEIRDFVSGLDFTVSDEDAAECLQELLANLEDEEDDDGCL